MLAASIEPGADIVCFIHRPEYYTHSSEDAEGHNIKGVAEFIVAKHRSGSTDTIKLHFVSKYARFENEGEQDLTGNETTYESKMNAVPASAGGVSPANDGFTPPPPNMDFLQGPEEKSTPF